MLPSTLSPLGLDVTARGPGHQGSDLSRDTHWRQPSAQPDNLGSAPAHLNVAAKLLLYGEVRIAFDFTVGPRGPSGAVLPPGVLQAVRDDRDGFAEGTTSLGTQRGRAAPNLLKSTEPHESPTYGDFDFACPA